MGKGDIFCRPKARDPVASGDQIGRPYTPLIFAGGGIGSPLQSFVFFVPLW